MKRRFKYRLAEMMGHYLMRKRKGKGPYPSTTHHVAAAAKAYNIDCVLDVGGHFGGTALALRDLGFNGWIISFEPNPKNFEKIAQLAKKDSKWRVFNYALGDKDSELELSLPKDGTLTSFLPSNNYGKKRFGKNLEIDEKVMAKVKRLDSVIDEILKDTGAEKLFLKMDTQGFDIAVFAGTGKCRDKILGLQSELAIKPIYEGMPNYLDGLNTYKDAGYILGGMYPVSWLEDGQTLLEADVVMFRA